MKWTLPDYLMPPPIMGVTINTIWLTPDVRIALYTVMLASLAAGMAIFLLRGTPFAAACRRSLLLAFFTAGILAAVRADIGWSSWIAQDIGRFGGLSTDEKLVKMDGRLYDFVRRAKSVVRGDYTLYSSDTYLPLRGEYFLLPLRNRPNAPFIIVLVDQQAVYDQKRRTFTRGDTVITNVDMVMHYSEQAFVLKRS